MDNDPDVAPTSGSVAGRKGRTLTPELIVLLLTCLVAGLVYGFAGFGAALIYMPVAVALIDPVLAIAAFAIASIGSIIAVVPQAWAQADKRASLTMLGAAVVFLPLGIWVLRQTDPTALRWVVSAIVLGTLGALLAGWRYRSVPGIPAWLAVGGGVGFLGGATGLNGPILVLFQLGGQDEAARSRANTIIVLSLSSFALLPLMALQGLVTVETLRLGALFLPVYMLGAYLGRRLFIPARAGLYRGVAYTIVALAALTGLPIWE